MIGYIYRITNIITNDCYVGITENFKQRKKKHITELNTNKHHSPKLQNAWNYYGADKFEWTVREIEISCYDDLYDYEIQEIEKYDSYNNGYNCNSGGRISDWKQKVKNEDIVKFLCVQWKYGDGYGKTCEDVFGWSRGTASAAKRKIRFIDANITFENLSDAERNQIAQNTFNAYELDKAALKRQLTQGGCVKAYQLTQDDYNFAFAAQELGYSYTQVANYLGIKPATVKDWFNGRSRKKNKEVYLQLTGDEKSLFHGRVKTAELSGNPKSESSN